MLWERFGMKSGAPEVGCQATRGALAVGFRRLRRRKLRLPAYLASHRGPQAVCRGALVAPSEASLPWMPTRTTVLASSAARLARPRFCFPHLRRRA